MLVMGEDTSLFHSDGYWPGLEFLAIYPHFEGWNDKCADRTRSQGKDFTDGTVDLPVIDLGGSARRRPSYNIKVMDGREIGKIYVSVNAFYLDDKLESVFCPNRVCGHSSRNLCSAEWQGKYQ